MRGDLKRKFSLVDEDACSSSSPLSSLSSPTLSEWESDGDSNSPQSPDFTPSSPAPPDTLPIRSILKRPKAAGRRSNVRFHLVTVFHFPRCQGFTSVPSRGGATLGMVRRHSALYTYTLAEHALEQRQRRREKLRERRREEKLQALRRHLVASGAVDRADAERLAVDQVPDEDLDVHVSDAELEDGGFLQPLSSKRRQALLRAAGVKRVDKEEKRQLHSLRVSREDCGCDCQGFCEPETCACSLADIKCQMDRFNFPCGCSKDGCGNPQGRIEFNTRRAQAHYIHTVARLELEGRLQQEANRVNQRGGPEEDDEEPRASPPPDVPNGRCPFGFTAERQGAPLAAPSSPPTFRAIPESSAMEENSSSSDMTDSSCSSTHPEESDGAGGSLGRENLPEGDEGGLTRLLSKSDSENDHSMGSDVHPGEPLTQVFSNRGVCGATTDAMGPLCASGTPDPSGRASVAEYLDENANQASDFVQDFPNTPSPSIDYSSSRMDLSLSSDSDLEFFDSDYTSGPLHNSFKGHTHPDNFHHLQILSSLSLPQYNESSTYLLESLIGLSEP